MHFEEQMQRVIHLLWDTRQKHQDVHPHSVVHLTFVVNLPATNPAAEIEQNCIRKRFKLFAREVCGFLGKLF